MTREKQRIAIATACGLQNVAPVIVRNVKHQGNDITVGISSDSGWIPDYLGDLNAMHEAEKVLNQMQSRANAYHLAESEQNETWASCHIWHQSASQRAEAFLRTLGLWEDAQ